jgi:alkaline phosphatase D
MALAYNATQWLVVANSELQWSDLYYRGYYELHISAEQVEARYFGLPTIVFRNNYKILLANFTIKSGANKLTRPVGGGVVESGTLKSGKTLQTNLTVNTANGIYFISHYDLEVL